MNARRRSLPDPLVYQLTVLVTHGKLATLKQLLKSYPYVCCTSDDADIAATHGYLKLLKYLASTSILATTAGADGALADGHLHVVKYLHSLSIVPTYNGLLLAIRRRRRRVVKWVTTKEVVLLQLPKLLRLMCYCDVYWLISIKVLSPLELLPFSIDPICNQHNKILSPSRC